MFLVVQEADAVSSIDTIYERIEEKNVMITSRGVDELNFR